MDRANWPSPRLTRYRLVCPACAWTTEPELRYRCPDCGTALETGMDLRQAAPRDAEQPEVAFADYLPLSGSVAPWAASVRTPCRRADRLGEHLGMSALWIKDETVQPTGSTKDRLASVMVAVLREFGVTEFVASSTGNTALALARTVSLDGSMTAHFFCPRGAPTVADTRHWAGNVLHLVDGDYADTIAAAVRFADESGLVLDGGFFNWARREGLKVAYLEAFVQMPREPDVVVQAISSGMGMMAARRAVCDLQASGHMVRTPRLVMVQQDTCAPMVRGWKRGARELDNTDVVVDPDGLATAILLGDARASYPYMREIASATGGDIVSVTRADMVEAGEMLRETEAVDACYSSSAVVAAIRNLCRAGKVSTAATVLLHLTGRARQPT
jgi:threonine synthase